MITLWNISDYSLQEVFDQAVDHLRRQGEVAMVGNDCRYRCVKIDALGNERTLRCAVGCFIPEEEYLLDWEGIPVTNLPFDNGMSGECLKLLREFQSVHDAVHTYNWEYEFGRLSRLFGLNLKPKENDKSKRKP